LGRESRRATLLEVLAAQPYQSIPRHELLKTAGVGMDVLRKAAEQGLVALNDDKTHVRLTIAPEQWLPTLLELRSATQLYAILDTLAQHQGVLAVSELYQLLPNANYNHLEKLQEAGYLTLGQSEVWRNSLARKTYVPTEPPQLTPEQSILWERISASMQGYSQDHGVFLLHGVTGSGKTELYIRAAELALSKGQQALILVPEIALTAQMVQRFAARFAGKVALIHSSLSAGERYDTWRRAREGLVQVVIGARSALFTPFPNLGLIVLDEEHDDSYKQSPPIPSPYYHSRDFAIEYMRLMGGTVILGSATPDVETYYAAQQGRYLLLELPNRVLAHRKQIEALAQEYHIANPRYESVGVGEVAGLALPPVQVVDMRQELMAGNISIFSRALATALSETLHLDQQALLFLNRRGSATFVFCRDCGYIARCPRCDTPLTFHRQGELLTCHGCGHREVNPTVCPDCHSHRIKYLGQGTEMIEKTVSELFPHARVMRWDQDTATSHHEHERIYDAFANHEADILVGTQMIAKGLDLPKVTLVGVISGDTALGLPDFRAIETTFQLLTQVAGRAGRSPLGGRVILQTYQPLHYAVQAAAKHDYHSFYAREIDYRRQLQWPPFTRVARLLFQDRVPQKAESEARRLAETLLERIKALNFTSSSLVGPVPCFFARQDNIYRWHILLRSTDPLTLLQGLDVGDSCILDIDPVNVL
jgi:primosomal protein N' (replication factor Y)